LFNVESAEMRESDDSTRDFLRVRKSEAALDQVRGSLHDIEVVVYIKNSPIMGQLPPRKKEGR
jgi:hypothetical protein